MGELFPLSRLQEDCQLVLADVLSRWRVPADALYEAIALQGWSLRQDSLPSGVFCQCDAWNQELILSEQFHEELTCPGLHRAVQNWVLATQLGQLRLHLSALLKGQNRKALDLVATEYAMTFLLPEPMLSAHPDVAYLIEGKPNPSESWRRLARVAEHFQVPTGCVQSALARYGLVNCEWNSTSGPNLLVHSCAS